MSASSYYNEIKGELTYFGKNAVADIGRIMTLVQGLKISEREGMKVVQDICITHFQEVNGVDTNKARQSSPAVVVSFHVKVFLLFSR
jgi:hypothetical protein